MKNVLIISGHTNLTNDSVANKTIIEELRKAHPEYQFNVLSEAYPNYVFDVEAEQEKLRRADVIVFQFPVFWYSMPSLLRKWIEDVVVHGFAYGSEGTALQGKKPIASFTTGGPAEAYTAQSFVGYTIEQILDTQLKPTANLCGMQLQPFVYTCGVSYANRTDAQALETMKQRCREHAVKLAEVIENC